MELGYSSQIYLDYNATTPCKESVVKEMLPYFNKYFGNASSSHHPFGWLAKDALDESKNMISKTLGISQKEFIFTSGSTESINSVLKGLYKKNKSTRNHIITSKAEHKAVLDVCEFLEKEGAKVTYLDVTSDGLIDIKQLESELSKDTLVVSIMFANNETGVMQPLDLISQLCKKNRCLLFSDATQALGKTEMNDFFKQVDFACFSGHKLYGPKGVGITYIKEKSAVYLDSFIQGGGQQSALRGGTYNIPAIIGIAFAIVQADQRLIEEKKRLEYLRNLLQNGLSTIEESIVNGLNVDRLTNTLNISFKYIDGEILLRSLSTSLAVSNGSACKSAGVNPSHVLIAMGISPTLAFSSLRFSLGLYTSKKEIKNTITLVSKEIAKQRESNILWERREV